jgi:hypothetical protein
MQLDSKFKMVMDSLETPTPNHYAGDKQICYLTFDPELVIEVKRSITSWLSLAKGYDYSCSVLSMATVINNFFRNNPRRNSWTVPDIDSSFEDIVDFYKNDLGSMITENKVIEKAILSEQEKIKTLHKPVLIITDLEAIHPFTRFGPIEQKLYTEIEIPIIILYPGSISGSSLEFLNFYPPDGNYRSKHF